MPETFSATLANDHKCVDKCSVDGKKLLDSPPLMTPCIITIGQLLTTHILGKALGLVSFDVLAHRLLAV